MIHKVANQDTFEHLSQHVQQLSVGCSVHTPEPCHLCAYCSNINLCTEYTLTSLPVHEAQLCFPDDLCDNLAN